LTIRTHFTKLLLRVELKERVGRLQKPYEEIGVPQKLPGLSVGAKNREERQ
jgi:hypothetical protein